jgi:crotonobetainyl-CoA:carnitine CoA-transferase CaiB-like acyl-CoA transferase
MSDSPHRHALRAALEAALGRATSAALVADLTAAGVSAGPVNDIPAAQPLAERLGLDPMTQGPRHA